MCGLIISSGSMVVFLVSVLFLLWFIRYKQSLARSNIDLAGFNEIYQTVFSNPCSQFGHHNLGCGGNRYNCTATAADFEMYDPKARFEDPLMQAHGYALRLCSLEMQWISWIVFLSS